ncbi:MAG: hypothetical protein A4S09_12990 [Proteobacteria bacterium SG_bin7]|nr:MAG: hypothetical protein A4S09_12990 [Proteobacteria bacterium SG_bin7]
MQIYELLKEDHIRVKGLLKELVNLDNGKPQVRLALITQIRDELVPHARAEEAVFYNALRTHPAAKEIMSQVYREHIQAEAMLKVLQAGDKLNRGWKKTAIRLKKALENHISEEENKVFPIAKRILSSDDSVRIGEAFEAMKPKVRAESFLGTTIDLIANLLPPRFMKSFLLQERLGSEN